MMNEGEMCGAVAPWCERTGVDGCDEGTRNHREVRLAQLETLAVIHPVRIRHHKNHLKHIARREVVRKQCQLWRNSRRRLTRPATSARRLRNAAWRCSLPRKLVTCRNELTPCRVEQNTSRSMSCRCTPRCARAAKSLLRRKNMVVAT